MAPLFDDGESIRVARRHFVTAMTAKNAMPPERPVKMLIDALFVALNTGAPKDIQRAKIWIIDYILPSSERTHLFHTFFVTLSRAFQDGALPTSGNRFERSKASHKPGDRSKSVPNEAPALAAQRKRLNMLNVLSDVLATMFPSQLEIPRKELPLIDRTSIIYELKHHLIILTQLAAVPPAQAAYRNDTPDIDGHIVNVLMPNWIKRGIFAPQELDSLKTAIESHVHKDIDQVAEELKLDQEIDVVASVAVLDAISLDKVLPSRHHLPDHPSASWDTLPAMNGLFLRRIRGFPLRAGGLQNGLLLQNAGQRSSEQTKRDIITTYTTATRLTRRFTAASGIADIDELGNVIPTQREYVDDDDKSDSAVNVRSLNYAALVKEDITTIRDLDARFLRGALGYDGVPRLARRGKFGMSGAGGINADLERASGAGRGRFEGGARFAGNRGGYRGRGASGFNSGNGFGGRGQHRGNHNTGYANLLDD